MRTLALKTSRNQGEDAQEKSGYENGSEFARRPELELASPDLLLPFPLTQGSNLSNVSYHIY